MLLKYLQLSTERRFSFIKHPASGKNAASEYLPNSIRCSIIVSKRDTFFNLPVDNYRNVCNIMTLDNVDLVHLNANFSMRVSMSYPKRI